MAVYGHDSKSARSNVSRSLAKLTSIGALRRRARNRANGSRSTDLITVSVERLTPSDVSLTSASDPGDSPGATLNEQNAIAAEPGCHGEGDRKQPGEDLLMTQHADAGVIQDLSRSALPGHETNTQPRPYATPVMTGTLETDTAHLCDAFNAFLEADFPSVAAEFRPAVIRKRFARLVSTYGLEGCLELLADFRTERAPSAPDEASDILRWLIGVYCAWMDDCTEDVDDRSPNASDPDEIRATPAHDQGAYLPTVPTEVQVARKIAEEFAHRVSDSPDCYPVDVAKLTKHLIGPVAEHGPDETRRRIKAWARACWREETVDPAWELMTNQGVFQ